MSEENLYRGRFVRLVRKDGWEFLRRVKPVRAAFIAAVTKEGRLLLTEEYRIPVDAHVIGMPAGLIGDDDGNDQESVAAGARRELLEEAGYQAKRITVLTQGPTSPGQIDEVIAVVLAEGLTKTTGGGGVSGEKIKVIEVPLEKVDGWLKRKAREGRLIDPKVYTALYFLRRKSNTKAPRTK